MKRVITLLAVALFGAATLFSFAGQALASDVDVTVGQASIDMNLFYNGAAIPVTGQVPEGSQVVVRFTGKPDPNGVTMKQKGRAMGLLWMNMNTLHFSNMPPVSLIATSAPLSGLGAAGEKLGLAGITESIAIEPASADRKMLLPELLKLKKSEGLYREDEGAVTLEAPKDGRQAFRATINVPSRLFPGDYSIEVFAVKDGQLAGQNVAPITARLVGVPAFMANLAFNHGLWYGIFASVVAIIAGLLVGVIFRGKGGAH